MIETEIKAHKRKLNHELQSIKVMLANKRHSLDNAEWLELVERTKQSIICNPFQYLDSKIPTHETLEMVVNKIFSQFLEDQNIR